MGNGGIGDISGPPRASACGACFRVSEADIRGLALDIDATDDETDNDTDELNGWSTANWAKSTNEHPRLKYADDPDTDSINECELLPDYDHENDANCVSGGTFCCGQELPNQRLYAAIANVAFTHDHDADSGTRLRSPSPSASLRQRRPPRAFIIRSASPPSPSPTTC